ncbi:HipA domain-containing protein [Mycolicibacterium sp.]|uniref:HipA domain-containing protein n=1 Tax=Mycolicibacterium sp. TaxID=2320850 RepID=UPI0025FC6CD9|nr:HipA domain-containing protein [Mycolicibacterium sp.]
MSVDIWLHGVLTAHATLKSRKVVIDYTDEGRQGYGSGAPILSCSLPALPGPNSPAVSRSFLEGLLPEGRALETAAARLRGVELDLDGAPAAPSDAMALLSEYGRECAGAVVVVPSGAGLPTDGHPSDPLNRRALADLIRSLPVKPLGADPANGIRMSLGGAQDKLLLTRIADEWCTPINGYPSTHILKPTTVWPHSAENEALVLALSRACGLSHNAVWTEQIGDTTVLVAERYDRRIEADGRIHRLHQEDMCQAVGLRPKDKYRIGRPSERIARILREFADSPQHEILAIYKQVAFRALVGDEDGHGKNYSLMLHDGIVKAAPLYDSLCTLEYPELSGSMGAKIGAQQTLAKVDRQALLDEAKAMGLPARDAEQALDELTARIQFGVNDLPSGLTEGWPAERLIETVQMRAARLNSGEPLGNAKKPSRRRRTLDTATVLKRDS